MAPDDRLASPLGPLERRVMEALWSRAPAAPRDVLAALNGADASPLAYTTITTILVRLAEKGYVERRPDGRRFLYHPLVGPDDLDSVAGRRALARLVRRYGADNVARFAADLARVEPELLRRLHALADEEHEAE